MSEPDRSSVHVGYVVSRFPKTTETFIVREMEAVERLGARVSLFAVRRHGDQIVQPGAEAFLSRLVALSDLSPAAAAIAQLREARADPRRWLRLWSRGIGGNLGSFKFLVRAVVIAWGAPAAAAAARERDIDHLHAHWATHSALLAHLMSMLTGIPYSITLHAHDLHVDQTMLATKLRAATAAVTVSDHNARLIRQQFPDVADRTVVVHCGIDTAAVPCDRVRRVGPIDRVRVVTVAGLRDFKGHRHLLDAVDRLRSRGRDVVVDLVGDGPQREVLQRRAGDHVTFHGAVDVDRAMEIVRGADLFVMPSVELADGRRDGIPVALMEAMAIGRPVIATTVSGIPELVRDGVDGVLVPPADPDALAAAIERFADDPATFDEYAASARRTIEQRFDIHESGHRLLDIFNRRQETTP